MRTRRQRILLGALVVVIAAFAIMQVVPYGRNHTNPPVVSEPGWDRASTRALAVRACFACHSNETRWPWYSHVAPTSWLVQADVDEGRAVLNFSDWSRSYEEAGEAAEAVLDNSMPPKTYSLMHPSARLSQAEKRELANGLSATLGTSSSKDD